MARPRAVQLSGTKGVKLKQVRKKLVDLVLDSTSDFLVSFVAVAAEREGKNFVGASSLGSKQIKALLRGSVAIVITSPSSLARKINWLEGLEFPQLRLKVQTSRPSQSRNSKPNGHVRTATGMQLTVNFVTSTSTILLCQSFSKSFHNVYYG